MTKVKLSAAYLTYGTVLKAAEPVGRPDHCQELLQREQSAGHRGCPWASPGIKIKRTPAV